MKTRSYMVSLFVLSLMLSGLFWAIKPALPQAATGAEVRAYGLIDFRPVGRRNPSRDIRDKVADLREERWTRLPAGRRPNARVVSADAVDRLRGGPRSGHRWEAIALISAATDDDLVIVERYIERFYTHVEIWRIHD